MTPQKTGVGPARPAPENQTADPEPAAYRRPQSRRYGSPKELLDRSPPRDVEAERAVLAVVLLNPRRIGEAAAVLEQVDFSDAVNRTIFGAMLRLHRRGLPPDITMLIGELRDTKEYGHNTDPGVCAHDLVELFRLYPAVWCLSYYIGRIAEISRRRHALERGIALIQAAHGAVPGPAVSPAIRRATQHALEHRAHAARRRVQ
jgi:replicative DNA helicase